MRKSDIKNGKLLRTAKAGATVYIPLPPVVVSAIDGLKSETPFWTGKSKPHTVASVWSETLKDLFTLAGVSDGTAHRYRHTFAVELLLAGVPIERVSMLLGHSSVKTTEKHYSAWSQTHQQQAEQDVIRTWQSDPVISTATPTLRPLSSGVGSEKSGIPDSGNSGTTGGSRKS